MEIYTVELKEKAKSDIKKIYASGNKSYIKKLELIIEQLSIHPTEGVGQPELLEYDLNGYWSRRINKKDRLIYRIEEEIVTVIVVSALGHYE